MMEKTNNHNSHQYKKHSHSLNRDFHPAESTPLWNDHLVVKIPLESLEGTHTICQRTLVKCKAGRMESIDRNMLICFLVQD